MNDVLEIEGLAPLLDDEDVPPAYLDLRIRVGDRLFRAEILIAGDEWVTRVQDRHRSDVVREEFYSSQSAAVVGAMLGALAAVQ